jgi:hypothetical protein
LVAVGKGGTILTSADGSSWVAQASGTGDWIYRVRYLGNQLIALGQNGMILASDDGAGWVRRNSGTTAWLTDVQWVDGTYFIVGSQGTVLQSADGVSWMPVGTITGKSFYSATQLDGRLVTVGTEGAILRAQVKPLSSAVAILRFPTRQSENVFLLAGEPDQSFTLDRSADLRVWTESAVYTLDRSGTLIIPDQRENELSAQFFRATSKP